MNDLTSCAVLLRENAQEDWELLGYSFRVSVGVSMAKFEAMQEWALGNEDFESKVITEANYDAGKLNAVIQRFTFATKGWPVKKTWTEPAPEPEPEPKEKPRRKRAVKMDFCDLDI